MTRQKLTPQDQPTSHIASSFWAAFSCTSPAHPPSHGRTLSAMQNQLVATAHPSSQCRILSEVLSPAMAAHPPCQGRTLSVMLGRAVTSRPPSRNRVLLTAPGLEAHALHGPRRALSTARVANPSALSSTHVRTLSTSLGSVVHGPGWTQVTALRALRGWTVARGLSTHLWAPTAASSATDVRLTTPPVWRNDSRSGLST